MRSHTGRAVWRRDPAVKRRFGLRMDRDTDIGGPRGRFPTTRRSAISATRSEDPAERTGALEALVATYWKPVSNTFAEVEIACPTHRENCLGTRKREVYRQSV